MTANSRRRPAGQLRIREDVAQMVNVVVGKRKDLDPADLLLVGGVWNDVLQLVEPDVDLLDSIAFSRISPDGFWWICRFDGVTLLGVEGNLAFSNHC